MVDDLVRKKGYLTLGSRMRRIGERLQAEVQQVMDERQVPIQSSHYPLLGALDEAGPMSIGDLADALGVSQPGITRSVGQLAKQKIVAIRRDKSDQRRTVVALATLGQQLVDDGRKTIWPQIENCLVEILSGQSGSLLDQLNILEDGLRDSSFSQRIARMKGSQADG